MTRYPHLLPADAALLDQYLASVPDKYSDVFMDVHVGEGRDPGPSFDDNIRRMAIQLSLRRIDCVAFAVDHVDIIEVTTAAASTALGQLMAYPALYVATFHPTVPVAPLLITLEFKTDMQQIFEFYSIPYIILPPTPLAPTGDKAP